MHPPAIALPPRSADAIVVGALFMGAMALTPSACARLTPPEAVAAEVAVAAGCVAMTLIPVVGGLLGAACVGEEATVRAALDHAVATSAPDGGARGVGLARSPDLGAELTGMRAGRRKVVGRCPGGFTRAMVAVAQAHLDTGGM